MQHEPPGLQELLEMGVAAAFAAVGGFLGYALRNLEQGGRFTLAGAFAEVGGAAFVGVLTLLLCKALNLDWVYTGLTVGVFSWLGANASIRLLERLVFKRLGLSGLKPLREQGETDGRAEG
ncbi:superfamily III holin [Pseudomonas phage Ppu-503]|nr:superfamily III holin [Pseudomonas phage Ppu-503]